MFSFKTAVSYSVALLRGK